ncbi:uncharacterized protein DUF1983 [Rhizobium subbaraonis]|uniref:Uncharacterized protein DUF1983 n=1 Tax=Rhizobium subbaraonis TaxID=908946 RepID=A0A285UC35_9HYPH|nr:phage tail protein [Rhizobium subbaraonis]SOC38968.1 uncharacterized protein DUF1983 [Rhizobium subbaraonis]
MAIFSSIAAGISGLLAGTFLASGVGAFILKAAVGIGLNLLASSLAGQPEQTPFAIQGQLQTGGDVARSFPIGYTATAGSLVYANTWGEAGKTPNAYFTQVIALADLPGSTLAGLWVNGEKCTIDFDNHSYPDWGFPVTEYEDDGDNALWIKFYDGTQTAADPFLVNSVSSENRPYESTRVGVGVAYVIVTAQIKEELFTGFPQFKFELNGCKLYDPSKDSSVGGNGPQRWANPSTWGGDGDHLPAVQLYNVLRGITFQGAWFYGLQSMSAARLPVDHWIAQIGKCRATTKGTGGVQEPKFRCGGEIQIGAQISEAVKAILTSAQARLSEAGGTYKMHIGVSDAAVYGITDADILSTEEQSFTPFFGLADTVNGITATYPSPAEGWNAKAAPPRYSATFEAEDGNRRLLADVSLDFVPYKAQVQRLMKSALEEARRARRHTFVLPPAYWPLEAGDFITWTSVRNGYVAKKFRVDGVIDKENLDIVVDMTEVDPADYSWDQDVDFRTEPDGKLDRSKPLPQPIVDWYAEPALIEDENGTGRRPAILLAWDNSPGSLVDIEAVQFAVRLTASQKVIYRGRTDDIAAGSSLISQGLLPATPYQVRGKLVPRSSRKTVWSDWFDVTTFDIRLSDDDVYLPGMLAEIEAGYTEYADFIGAQTDAQIAQVEATITEVEASIDQIQQDASQLADTISAEQSERVTGAIETAARYRGLLNRIEGIVAEIADQDFSNYKVREEIRRTLNVRMSDMSAGFDERINVAVSDTAAIAQRTVALEANSASLASKVLSIETAYTTADEALAQQISLLSAGTDNQFDPAKLWNFLSTIESWTGNGTPTFIDGSLRPANHVTEPYVVSPAALAIDANAYRQVRLRIQKFGAPVWVGQCWWKRDGDTTWDAARRVTVVEPLFDTNGFGLITFQMPWSGAIDSIRLDLSTAQTATDYFIVDWVGIGSPSPGASRAELIAERTARITAQSALASDIVAVQAVLNDPDTGLSAVSQAVDAIETRVENTETGLTALGSMTSGLLTEIEGKATIDSVQQLQNEIEALDIGGLSSVGSAVTAIRNSLQPIVGEVLDQDFANFIAQMEGKRATAEASQSLTTKIEQTNESLSIVASAVTKVQAELPNLATVSALSALDVRVTAAEGKIDVQASAITEINAALPNKASATALNDLNTRVMSAEGTISAQATAITNINTTLGSKANNSAVTALSTRIDEVEGAITSQSTAMDRVKADLGWDDSKAQGARATALTIIRADVTTAYTLSSAKNKVYRQATAPTGTAAVPLVAGDIWYNTSNGSLASRWSGSAWQEVTDARISASAESINRIKAELNWNDSAAQGGRAQALSVIRADVTATAALADSKNKIYRQSAAPTGTTAVPLRTGDIWYASGDGNKPYRWDGSAWVEVTDARIIATATKIEEIEVKVNDVTASARIKMETVAGPTGYARIAARVRYGETGSYRDAGYYIDVPSDTSEKSEFLVYADQFVIRNGSNKDKPFVVSGGVVRMNVAHIGTVNAGVLNSQNGKMTINLNSGTIVITS